MSEILSSIQVENHSQTQYNFSNIQGMNTGKMFKLTEVMTKYLGNSFAAVGPHPALYNNMFYSLCRSYTGEDSTKENSADYRTCVNFPVNLASSAVISSLGGQTSYQMRDVLSEMNRVNNFSHLSDAGSDEYRNELLRNDNYLEDFEVFRDQISLNEP